MDYCKFSLGFEKFVNRAGGGGDTIDAFPLEIRVAFRSDHEAMTGSNCGKHFGKIEGDLVEGIIEETRHVPLAGPAADIAVHVIAKGIEAAVGNDDFDALVKGSGVDAVVSAKRMAD